MLLKSAAVYENLMRFTNHNTKELRLYDRRRPVPHPHSALGGGQYITAAVLFFQLKVKSFSKDDSYIF